MAVDDKADANKSGANVEDGIPGDDSQDDAKAVPRGDARRPFPCSVVERHFRVVSGCPAAQQDEPHRPA